MAEGWFFDVEQEGVGPYRGWAVVFAKLGGSRLITYGVFALKSEAVRALNNLQLKDEEELEKIWDEIDQKQRKKWGYSGGDL